MIRPLLDRLYLACGYLATLFMVGIAVCILAQIAARMAGATLDATEASGFCLAAATFFGLAHTLRSGSHVRINLFVNRMPEPMRARIEIFNALLGTCIAVFLAWHMWELALQSLDFHDVSPGLLAMPMWIPQSGAAIGITVLAIALIDELHWRLGGGTSRCESPDEVEADRPVA